MTGISSIVAAGGPYGGGGGAPLSVTCLWNGGNLNVSGASGVASPAVFVLSITGGVPPYNDSFALSSNPSGKVFLTNSPDGIHTTIAWSGFTLNEVEGFTGKYTVTDSAGTKQSPSSSGTIRRTS